MEDEKRLKREPYFTTSHKATDSKEYFGLSFEAKALYLWLQKWSNRYGSRNNGWFTRSVRKLSVDLSVSSWTINRAKRELVEAKLLIEESGKGRKVSNRYLIP